MKKLASLVLILALLCGTALAGTSLGRMFIVNCKKSVTLREWPSTSANAIYQVPKGAAVYAYTYNSDFYECYYDGYHGYILNDYVGKSKPKPTVKPTKKPKPTPTPEPWFQPEYGLATQKLSLREEPTTKSAEVGTFHKAGEWIALYARHWDKANSIWWVKCSFDYKDGTYWGWTGLKRFDRETFDLYALPEE